MNKFWRVSIRRGAPPWVVGDYPKKSDASRVLRDVMKQGEPIDEYDSAQMVPYKDGQRDWRVASIRFVPSRKGQNKPFKWTRGEGIR